MYQSGSQERCSRNLGFLHTSTREKVELNGFLDLSAMAAAAGVKLRARNMTALGVQVVGTVLDKNKSMGDEGIYSRSWKLCARF